MKSKKFYLLANQMKDPDGSITKKVGDYLGSLGMEYAIHPRDDNSLKGTRYLYSNPDDVPEGTDCIIAMGGDGTILQASRDLHALQIPILGVNIGTLGFLTDATMETIFESIDKFIANEYELDTRMMIYGQVYRGQEMVYENFALNDIVITRSGGLKVIDFDISVNNEFLNSYVADGVIIATATGSTAYSMSAGGPLIQPKAKMLMITPICPHTVTSRSILLDYEDEINIEMTDKKRLGEERTLAYDGETSCPLKPGDRIVIRRFHESAIFIKTNKISFLQKIRQCFI
ncbi:MAG: NAD(+)/NADH kinase [Clostridiales bacterium]|nr:NAD(+)/NADH kinase [Clostridiales bacterium]MDU1041799.1 NAD(+)/NADH kinase [Clostridiales bacterium]